MIEVYIDGSSLGNPGKIGIGYVIYKGKKLVKENQVSLGIGTNNLAEYMALLFSLQDVLQLGEKACKVYSDSKLLCEQIGGSYRVKSVSLYPLYILAKRIIAHFSDFSIIHISRERNMVADKLAREAAMKLFI